jgi:hypothetical protein
MVSSSFQAKKKHIEKKMQRKLGAYFSSFAYAFG